MPHSRPLVLLIQLPIPPPGPMPVQGNVPLAAGYLKLFARRRGLEQFFRIEILPPALANALGDRGLVEEIAGRRPRLVAFTCYLWNIERTLWIAGRVKQALPDVEVAFGGPEITEDNRWVLDRPEPDYAVFGEGESTFADLLTAMGKKGTGAERDKPIPGLWTRARQNPLPREPLGSLDAVASPYVEGILQPDDQRLMLLETVRGCRYRCKYCYYPKSYRAIHSLSKDQIAASLRYANEHDVAEVFLLDPTLNQRPDFDALLGLLAAGNPERRFSYSAELRAEGIGRATARRMREANFKEVEIGLQSVSPEAQRLMGRTVDLPRLEQGARAMRDEGIAVRVDLIVGLPGDTVDSIRRGFDYLERARPFSELQIFQLSILPGTEFRRQAERLGLEHQQRPPYYVLRTPTLAVEQMYDLMAEAQDRFGIEFDVPPPPEPPVGDPGSPARYCVIDLDEPGPLPPAGSRAHAFTLWLRAADFCTRQAEAEALIARVLDDCPHTTLSVILEPTGDHRNLTPGLLDALLAVCHRSTSYLDWYYSLHPGRLGAKRLVVLLSRSQQGCVDPDWLAAMEEMATVVWA